MLLVLHLAQLASTLSLRLEALAGISSLAAPWLLLLLSGAGFFLIMPFGVFSYGVWDCQGFLCLDCCSG